MSFLRLLNPFRQICHYPFMVPVPPFKFQNLHKTVRNTRFSLLHKHKHKITKKGDIPFTSEPLFTHLSGPQPDCFPDVSGAKHQLQRTQNLENPLLHNTVVPQNHSRNLFRPHIAQFSTGERRDETDCRDRSTAATTTTVPGFLTAIRPLFS
uniref:(northern house mosquito) hypothetical protein n=1 Tax=Culex pipiens TaxID=7175 RepID=A0A8D8KTI1_CULPI